tara:strand:- start:303 stop:530 length:228 start_codon:yes stop_codon:yes gene_type:complete
MTADWIEEIPTWEKDYKKMMEGKLSKRQLELLDGAEIKSHEGMVYGGMYSNWKKSKGYDVEENIKPVNNSEDSAE